MTLVGTRQASNELVTDWAREQIMKSLRTGVVRKLTAEKWPVLGIAGRTAEIEVGAARRRAGGTDRPTA